MKVVFTSHSKQRMNQRLILEREVTKAIKRGKYLISHRNVFEVYYKDIKIVVEENLKKKVLRVVSVMYESSFNNKILNYMRKNKVSRKKAIYALKYDSRLLKNISVA